MEVTIDKNAWLFSVIAGILLLIIGLLMVALKQDSLEIILMIAGVLAIIVGALRFYGAFTAKDTVGMVIAALIIAVGIVLVVMPNLVSDVLMIILAIGLFLFGLITLLEGLKDRGQGTIALLFPVLIGALFIVIGIYALLNLDDTADIVMIIIGAIIALSGAIDIVRGAKLKGLF